MQISHIPHANILNFVAAEIIQRNSQTFHHLFCEYHERGTLFDHLKVTSIDVHGLLVLAESVASGLAHLHSEVPNNQGVLVKPAIAHCNLTSRSIYVKLDGKYNHYYTQNSVLGVTVTVVNYTIIPVYCRHHKCPDVLLISGVFL